MRRRSAVLDDEYEVMRSMLVRLCLSTWRRRRRWFRDPSALFFREGATPRYLEYYVTYTVCVFVCLREK